MKKNIVVIHGGGPTCVINASLYGVIQRAKAAEEIGHIYGALGGIDGILEGRLYPLEILPEADLEKLPLTPRSVLGTSRKRLSDPEYAGILEKLRQLGIAGLFANGGNGTMNTCARLSLLSRSPDLQMIGIPKTVDNDIPRTDHCPGYGSAARFTAVSALELGFDLSSMPRQIIIMETMGRNAGWLAASSALAGPDLIYFPELSFDEEEFLLDVKRVYEESGRALVVVSEGLRNRKGATVTPPILQRGRDVYFGHISAHLAQLVIGRLGIKARGEKPGLLGRASVALQSATDREDAVGAGIRAVEAFLEGRSNVMIGFKRDKNCVSQTCLIPLSDVANGERKLPAEFINGRGSGVTAAFIDYVTPLIGGALPEYKLLG